MESINIVNGISRKVVEDEYSSTISCLKIANYIQFLSLSIPKLSIFIYTGHFLMKLGDIDITSKIFEQIANDNRITKTIRVVEFARLLCDFMTTVKTCRGINMHIYNDQILHELLISSKGDVEGYVEKSYHVQVVRNRQSFNEEEFLISVDCQRLIQSECSYSQCQNCGQLENRLKQRKINPSPREYKITDKSLLQNIGNKYMFDFIKHQFYTEISSSKDLEKCEIISKFEQIVDTNCISKEDIDFVFLLLELLKNGTPEHITFIKEQLVAMTSNKYGMRWRPETIQNCLMLLKQGGSKCYNSLSNMIRLPSSRLLHDYSSIMKVRSGWNEGMILKVFEGYKEESSHGYITFDGIYLKSNLVFKRSTGDLMGWVDNVEDLLIAANVDLINDEDEDCNSVEPNSIEETNLQEMLQSKENKSTYEFLFQEKMPSAITIPSVINTNNVVRKSTSVQQVQDNTYICTSNADSEIDNIHYLRDSTLQETIQKRTLKSSYLDFLISATM